MVGSVRSDARLSLRLFYRLARRAEKWRQMEDQASIESGEPTSEPKRVRSAAESAQLQFASYLQFEYNTRVCGQPRRSQRRKACATW